MAESKLNWDKYSSDEEKKEKIEKPLQKPKKNKKPKHKLWQTGILRMTL